MTEAALPKVRVGVVGATGLTGQQFLVALAGHPRFEVTTLAASARSAGKTYAEALRDGSGQLAWYADEALPAAFAAHSVKDARHLDAEELDLIFSCVDAATARELEAEYARVSPVISTASAFRQEPDVPLLVPGVNSDHVELLQTQRRRRGWSGFIAPNPNCTVVGLAITLAPLHRAFGIERVHMVSMQSVSGAGRSPGVIALDVVDNIVPFIPKEEDKVEFETRKILGELAGDSVRPASFALSATCTRVAVLEGHTEAVHLELSKETSAPEIASAWRGFAADFCAAGYPSAPPSLIFVHDDPFRPQVRLDRNCGDGMTTVVGRLRRDQTSKSGWKYLLVSHNTKMGAAKGCLLVAEFLHDKGLIAAR